MILISGKFYRIGPECTTGDPFKASPVHQEDQWAVRLNLNGIHTCTDNHLFLSSQLIHDTEFCVCMIVYLPEYLIVIVAMFFNIGSKLYNVMIPCDYLLKKKSWGEHWVTPHTSISSTVCRDSQL